jgi:hypothetical protein
MPPSPAGTASCMSRPRSSTSFSASANDTAFAATSAVYSPRLWPASAAGGGWPFDCHARHTATPAASSALPAASATAGTRRWTAGSASMLAANTTVASA